MKGYILRDTVRANVQCIGIWLQIGATVVGLAPRWWWNYTDPRHRGKRARRVGVIFVAPAEFCATRTIFMVEIGSREFGYRTRGELDPRDCRYREIGWKFGQ